jgi:hypothetical protein
MIAPISLALVLAYCATPSWSNADPGQSHPKPTSSGLLAVDEAALEVAAATGGFYYFWQPGEFSRFAADERFDIFASTGTVIEQIEGRVHGTIELPFEIEPNDTHIIVRVGLQSLGEIELFAPGDKTPYAGDTSTRTAHMLFVDLTHPAVGTWRIRLIGEGLYLTQVVANRELEFVESSESARPRLNASEVAELDLESFRTASPDERWRALRRLPASRGNTLARALLHDSDPGVAYVAAGWLARQGDLDDAVPVYARILVRGENETALHGRMGYDWIHDDDDTRAQRILEALSQHLRRHLNDYSATEQLRAEVFLRERIGNPPP